MLQIERWLERLEELKSRTRHLTRAGITLVALAVRRPLLPSPWTGCRLSPCCLELSRGRRHVPTTVLSCLTADFHWWSIILGLVPRCSVKGNPRAVLQDLGCRSGPLCKHARCPLRVAVPVRVCSHQTWPQLLSSRRSSRVSSPGP
jgi:hypothetical protein